MAKSPIRLALRPLYRKVMGLFPPRLHAELDYFRAHGRFPNLKHPRGYNEKVVWRTLYDRDPRLPELADKIKVKDYIGNRCGWQYVIPTLRVYNSVEEMDFSQPPLCNPPYVIKANHGCGMNIFVRKNDGTFDPPAIKKKLMEFLAFDYTTVAEEWAYSQIERKILVEPLIWEDEGFPIDYKMYVFDGKFFMGQVIVDRAGGGRCNLFDRNWKWMGFEYVYHRYKGEIARPKPWEEMVALAEAIGKEFSHVRVDLYAVNDQVKFGELTFYTTAGHGAFRPEWRDYEVGALWKESAWSAAGSVVFTRHMIPEPIKKTLRPAYRKLMSMLSSRTHILLEYLRAHYCLPDLKNPRTFNEKIAWRKLHDRDPRFPLLVDKVRAKEYVADKFGRELIIPTLAVFDSAAALDFSKPPLSNPPYVLKANHASNMNIFVRKGPIDEEGIRKKLAQFLKLDYSKIAEEWAYSQVERKILVEPFIETPKGYLPDFRFHVFGGKTYAIETVVDIHGNRRENMYDRDWNLLNIVHGGYPRYLEPLPRPSQLDRMIELAETLGRDFRYVRVDLYEIGGQVKFGELTFYPGGGNDAFHPREWDRKFGEQWIVGK